MRAAPPDFPELVASNDLPIQVEIEAWYAGQCLGVVPHRDASVTWTDGSLLTGQLKFEAPRASAWYQELPLAVRYVNHGSDPDDPSLTSDPLGADGQRVRVRYGIRRPGDRDVAWVQLGWFRIDQAKPDGQAVQVTAPDLMDLVQRARFPVPQVLDSTWFTYRNSLDVLLYPLVPFVVDGVPDRSLMVTKSWERERLDAVSELLESWPARGHLDESGTLVISPAYTVPELGPAIRTGAGGNASSIEPVANPDAGFNACVAIGRDPNGQDIQGIAYLTEGPRRWDGPYGRNPGFYASDMLTTPAQCREVARSTLYKWQTRQAETWEVLMAPDPRLELGDRRPITPTDGGPVRVGVATGIELSLTAAGGAMKATFAMEG